MTTPVFLNFLVEFLYWTRVVKIIFGNPVKLAYLIYTFYVFKGGKCWIGTYCPNGTSYPIPCDGGMFCSQMGLSAPEGLCDAGYYCPGGNSQPDPLLTLCPAGYYCEQGAATPTPCPSGTFSRVTGIMIFC